MNEEHFRRYAWLLVEEGVNLRPGQPLYIRAEVAHRQLVALLTEAAYAVGGGRVESRVSDPLQEAVLVRHGRLEDIELIHAADHYWYNEIVRHGGALIALHGAETPDLWDVIGREHPERCAAYRRARNAALGGFLRHGMERRRCPWVAAACPTPGWARQVFPERDGTAAFDQLAALVCQFAFADRADAHECHLARDRRLKARCRQLDELEIREIEIRGGTSELRLGLPRGARWLGGSQLTEAGQAFWANLPTEEVFTTPDRRLTEGRLAATRPLRLGRGARVEGMVLEFQGGRVVEARATAGEADLHHFLDTDDGARYLGEIALVGEDSAIAASGLYFDLLLFDENAAAHIALGKGFPAALPGGAELAPPQLEALGCNRSAIHADVMFGSRAVTIKATRSREGEVVLIDRGKWTERLSPHPEAAHLGVRQPAAPARVGLLLSRRAFGPGGYSAQIISHFSRHP